MRRRRWNRSERGAVLVELAIAIPLLLLLLTGIVEYGFAWQRQQLTTRAARSGARITSHLGKDPLADQEGLKAVLAGMGQHRNGLVRVVIFLDAGSGIVPSACLTSSQSGLCNLYTNFSGPPPFPAEPSVQWSPSSRSDSQLTGLDHVGVYVEYDHDWMIGTFPGDGLTISDTAVMSIEPSIT